MQIFVQQFIRSLIIIHIDMFKIWLICLLAVSSLATLEVYSPSCFKQQFKGPINYTLSNFGEIPYGQTIVGQIFRPQRDPELCDIVNETRLDTQNSATKNIMLVKRGTCKFTKKVVNAQNLGADLIIIYDNNPGDSPSVIMKNDGHGHLAEIPSLFISNNDGIKLSANDSSCPGSRVMRVVFEMDQAEISDVTLWLDANNRQTYIMARDFHKNDYYDVLKDRINLSIRFKIENKCADWICGKEDCIGTLLEKYCRNVEKKDNPSESQIKGVDLIAEQLREHFLWQELKTTSDRQNWWRYMAKFDHNICNQQADIEDCSFTTMREMGIAEDTIASIKRRTDEDIKNVNEKKATMIKQSYEESKEMGIFFYPEVTINNRNFYGLFKAPEVFEAICDSLIDPPRQCVNFIRENHEQIFNDHTGGIWKTIMIILLVMTVGFVVALLIYTKVIRREVNQQLSVQVNKMVQKYVNLTTQKTPSSSNSYNKFDS